MTRNGLSSQPAKAGCRGGSAPMTNVMRSLRASRLPTGHPVCLEHTLQRRHAADQLAAKTFDGRFVIAPVARNVDPDVGEHAKG